jgi:hypothetical protein
MTQSSANVEHYLKGVQFPATRQDLIDLANRNGAEPHVIDVIKALPDEEYGSVTEIMKGYGEEGRH